MEELVARILAQRKDLNREQIQGLIEQKKHEAQDLLSDEGAARLVAEELLVETSPLAAPSIEIRRLVSGLNDVTLTGKVLVSEAMRSFPRQDGSTGRIVKLLLGDETGKITCLVWDSKADEILAQGDLTGCSIIVRHGYTRAGLGGEVELNVGDRSELVVEGTFETTPIGEIREPAIEIHLLGVVNSRPRFYEFERNGQRGAVLRSTLADKTGSVAIVAWNEKADELRSLQKGNALRIQNGRLRRDNIGRLEIHLETRSRTTLLAEPPEGLDIPEVRFHRIAELKPDLGVVNLLARVVGLSSEQQVERKTGEKVKVSRVLIGDETGTISVSLWDDKAEFASHLNVGDIVRVEDGIPNLRLDQISVNVGRTAIVQKLEETTEAINVKINKIGETPPYSQLASVEGEVISDPETREVTTAKGEKVQVTSIQIRDDTGETRISFWRAHAKDAARLRAGSKIRVYGLLARPGLAGRTEFNTVQGSSIKVLTREEPERPSSNEIQQFIALKENEQVWVRAIILDAGEDATLTAMCTQCEEPIAPSNGQFLCRTHGPQAEPTWLLATRMRLDDGTDSIMADVRSKDPHILIGKSLSWAQKEILAKRMSTVALPIDATGKLTGMRIEAFGVPRRDPQTGKFVLHTEKAVLIE